tara:strand:- start:191 stop:433 length:243 start_codon:yes stop_codon:yes gene_type:complete
MSFEKKFLDFIKKEIYHGKKFNISAKTNLLTLGIIDSMDFVKLLYKLEKNYKIKFKSHEINEELGKLSNLKKVIKNKIKI